MKKILMLIFVISISFLYGNMKVNAKEVDYDRLTNVYVKQEDLIKGTMLNKIRKFVEYKTNHLLFSIELFSDVYNSDAIYEINDDSNLITDEVKEIAYVTEILYKKTNDLNYIGVGQKLIWEKLSSSDYVFFIEKNGIRNDNLHFDYVTSINNEISEIFPKLSLEENISLNFNESKDFFDENLDGYEIFKVDGESVSPILKENKLSLYGKKNGQTKIILKKDYSSKDYDMKYFKNEENADLISSGNFSIYKIINVNVNSGNLILNVINNNPDNNFKASYGVFENDNLIYQFNITKPGIYKEELPCGNYIVKQLSINSLFAKDKKINKVNIKNNEDTVIDLINALIPQNNESVEKIEQEIIEELPVYDNVEIEVPNTSKYTDYSIIYILILYVFKKIC